MKSNSNFYTALKQEEGYYDNYYKPCIKNLKKIVDIIFLRYNEGSMFNSFQKDDDIDCVVDDGEKNITISLKTVKHDYKNIFFETISNTTKGTLGWGYYSKADVIHYAMKMKDRDAYRCKIFKTKDILKLDLNKYEIRYAGTNDSNGNLLYKTEGRLIPWEDFECREIIIFKH